MKEGADYNSPDHDPSPQRQPASPLRFSNIRFLFSTMLFVVVGVLPLYVSSTSIRLLTNPTMYGDILRILLKSDKVRHHDV